MSDPDNDLMTLKTQTSHDQGGHDRASYDQGGASATQPARDGDLPLMGLFAVGFGLFAIFVFAPLFVPLTMILALIALFRGQILLGLLAIVLAVVGILNSWFLLGMFSIGALLAWFGF